jgi:hypothetical protein
LKLQIRPSAGLDVYFKPVQLDAPIQQHRLRALKHGQVDELLLSASARDIGYDSGDFDNADVTGGAPHLRAADFLVTRARNTSARVTFIEDPALLADIGGVGALLRY